MVQFFVIGAMKAGTSSLSETLNLLPNVSTGRIKEFNFFVPSKYASLSVEDYHNNFDPKCSIWGEVAPNYSKLQTFPGVAQRIYDYNPNAKIIFIKRNPVDRVLSELKMHHVQGEVNHETTFNWFEHRRPNSWKKANHSMNSKIRFGDFEKNYIIQNSRYEHQLQPFRALFHENVKTFSMNNLVSRENNDALTTLIKFIGAEPAEKIVLGHSHSSADRIIPSNFALELAAVNNKLNYKHWIHRAPSIKPILISLGFLKSQGKTWFAQDLKIDLDKFFQQEENK